VSSPYEPAQFASPTAPSGNYGYPGQTQSSSYLTSTPAENGGYAPTSRNSSYQPSQPGEAPSSAGYQPYGLTESVSMPTLAPSPLIRAESADQEYSPASYGYEPPRMDAVPSGPEVGNASAEDSAGGYEPPSFQPYGYEPPSYQPDFEANTNDDEDDAPKPKKKSFMDDDQDDIPALKAQDKGKSAKDRENEEMFRKAAEEDGKSTLIAFVTAMANANCIKQRNVRLSSRLARRAGALGAGLRNELNRPSLAAPMRLRRSGRIWENRVASCMIPNSSVGSTRSLVPRMWKPRLPRLRLPGPGLGLSLARRHRPLAPLPHRSRRDLSLAVAFHRQDLCHLLVLHPS
jgi:hypothetical protein